MRNDVRVVRGLAVAVVSLFLVGGAVFAADGILGSNGSGDPVHRGEPGEPDHRDR